MNTAVNPYLARIVVRPGVRSGRQCIRDARITVQEILGWLGSGATRAEILKDYPYLEDDDFKAVFAFAAQFPELRSGQMGHCCSMLRA